MPNGNLVKQRSWLCEVAVSERIPGDEADALLFAITDDVFATAIDEVGAMHHPRAMPRQEATCLKNGTALQITLDVGDSG